MIVSFEVVKRENELVFLETSNEIKDGDQYLGSFSADVSEDNGSHHPMVSLMSERSWNIDIQKKAKKFAIELLKKAK